MNLRQKHKGVTRMISLCLIIQLVMRLTPLSFCLVLLWTKRRHLMFYLYYYLSYKLSEEICKNMLRLCTVYILPWSSPWLYGKGIYIRYFVSGHLALGHLSMRILLRVSNWSKLRERLWYYLYNKAFRSYICIYLFIHKLSIAGQFGQYIYI